MGAALLKNFESYLGENWTPEVEQAWTDAYEKIANIMLEGAEHCESTFGRRISFSRVINRWLLKRLYRKLRQLPLRKIHLSPVINQLILKRLYQTLRQLPLYKMHLSPVINSSQNKRFLLLPLVLG